MSIELSRLDAASVLVIGLTVAVGVSLWPRLPQRVPIHVSATGTPGTFVSRNVAVLAMPIVMAATGALLKAVAEIDPPKSPRAYDAVVCSTMLLFLVVHLYTLGSSLSYRIPFVVLPVATGVWTVFVVGSTLKHEGVSL